MNSERQYVDLLFRVSRKYASWDPEIVVKVGDWGRITQGRRGLAFWRKNGTFMKEGNIFDDGKAKAHGIPEPIEYDGGESGEGETWVVSQNAEQVDVTASGSGILLAITQCRIKGAFKFSSGRGAILVMENDTISVIDPPGAVRRLLEDHSMRGFVVVSEVHRCSSYARLLTDQEGSTVALGLSVDLPAVGVASAAANTTWVRSVTSGNFRSQINRKGDRTYYPLFRLVSLTEEATAMGTR
ncbi:hypothetical protein B0H17DRAFT_918412 [Mycena rosella]|uniref:Uncharacterized protein n=1 Tax=Mycena rosella TaxID=1033263 RepID=A0AAD7GWG7_MYCRO|nr:hypothetical protein B0H17DRAFT_918412 [Mycena rosella]